MSCDGIRLEDPVTLLGDWSFERTIEDHLRGEVLRVDGTLSLVAEGLTRIRWSERGLMHREAGDLEVFRVLFLVEGAHDWDVTFEDGRPFHPWRMGEWVEHPCAADVYRGRVVADGRAGWSITWRVSGPQKDYVMTTILVR